MLTTILIYLLCSTAVRSKALVVVLSDLSALDGSTVAMPSMTVRNCLLVRMGATLLRVAQQLNLLLLPLHQNPLHLLALQWDLNLPLSK